MPSADIHSVMKQPSRSVYGKVYITYTDPMLDVNTSILSSGNAHNARTDQLVDTDIQASPMLFTLHENDLSGNYLVGDINSQVGWVSSQLSGPGGVFAGQAPFLTMRFSIRPVYDLTITFDDSRGAVAQDFSVTFERFNSDPVVYQYTDNTLATFVVPGSVTDVVGITITVTKIAREGYPVVILEVPVVSTQLYVGYKDESDIVSISMLEELTYEDDVEALGGMSANEVTVVLDNSDQAFFFNNTASDVASSLKRNRKIEPYLGAEVTPGEIEWYPLGTYWSYAWDVPVEGLTAKVIGFDTIGLLDNAPFTDHQTQVNKSIGELIEYVLLDAKTHFSFLKYNIDPALYDIIIPYAWFDESTYAAALRKITGCYPMHIYCDRLGVICAAPQRLHSTTPVDTWSGSTNVISRSYNSLYTVLPNVLNITVFKPSVKSYTELAFDDLEFDVADMPTRRLNFSSAYLSGISVTVDCAPTVQYTYEVFSRSIKFTFSGTGMVRSISCMGSAVDLGNGTTITRRNDDSVYLDGAFTRNIESEFIQTSSLANTIINRILSLSEQDRFDVSVEYRGNIALSINDSILLEDSIAPINVYNIKRHELFWNGALSGSAQLNT